MIYNTVQDIRNEFVRLLQNEEFIVDKTGVPVLEILAANFIADEEHVFGVVNSEYVSRELAWYKSMSLNVNDIPGEVPTIWKQVATPDGFINSNYGYCIYSGDNGYQFKNVVEELVKNPYSRRATMIYTRPSMHVDYNAGGKSDFICTWGTQHFIRNGQLVTKVNMRSNDLVFGYRNDFAWQKYVHDQLLQAINNRTGSVYGLGPIYWDVGSLHVYSSQFYLVDHYDKTGETSISKAKYKETYPGSTL